MGWLNKTSSSEKLGEILAEHCLQLMKQSPAENQLQSNEISVALFIAHRLGISFCMSLEEYKKREIMQAFDLSITPHLDRDATEELADRRGPIFAAELYKHLDELNNSDTEPILQRLQFFFGQLLAGGELDQDGEPDGPLVLGDLSIHFLKVTASTLFLQGFLETVSIIIENINKA